MNHSSSYLHYSECQDLGSRQCSGQTPRRLSQTMGSPLWAWCVCWCFVKIMQIGISSQTCSLMGMEHPEWLEEQHLQLQRGYLVLVLPSSQGIYLVLAHLPADSAPGVRLLAPAVWYIKQIEWLKQVSSLIVPAWYLCIDEWLRRHYVRNILTFLSLSLLNSIAASFSRQNPL